MFKKIRKKQGETTISAAKVAIWYMICNMFVKGLTMLSTPIFTRLLSTTDYGLFNNLTSWENVLMIIVTLDFSASIARAKYDFEGKMDEFIASILLASNVVTLVVYFIVECNQTFFENLFKIDIMYIRMLFVYLLFMPAFNFLQIQHQIYYKYKFFVALSIGSAVLRTVISIVLVINMENKLLGRSIGYFIPITICNVLLWLLVMMKERRVSWKCIKYASRISLPLIPHGLSGVVLSSVDRIMITNFCGAATTAIYSVAYSVSMFASLLWTSMNQAWAPWLFDRLHENNKKKIIESSKIFLGLFVVLILGILLISPEIIYFLGGKKYYEARFAMPPIVMGFVFQFIYSMYVNIEMYSKKTFTISIGTILAAGLNFFLNLIFIPRYGYVAAAYTTMVGYFALLVFHYIIVKRTIKEFADIYDTVFIVVMILVVVVAGVVSNWLYQYYVIRYAVLGVYIIELSSVIYRQRKNIMEILKR